MRPLSELWTEYNRYLLCAESASSFTLEWLYERAARRTLIIIKRRNNHGNN
jgi:hypothetical protein